MIIGFSQELGDHLSATLKASDYLWLPPPFDSNNYYYFSSSFHIFFPYYSFPTHGVIVFLLLNYTVLPWLDCFLNSCFLVPPAESCLVESSCCFSCFFFQSGRFSLVICDQCLCGRTGKLSSSGTSQGLSTQYFQVTSQTSYRGTQRSKRECSNRSRQKPQDCSYLVS